MATEASEGVVVRMKTKRKAIVRTDDGREVEAYADLDVAGPSHYVPGTRVFLGPARWGRPIIRPVDAPPSVTKSAPSTDTRPLPPMLQRAVSAALAIGESPGTIAARFGIAMSRVRA